jgi:hypothetical protein
LPSAAGAFPPSRGLAQRRPRAALSQRLIQGFNMHLPPKHEENARCVRDVLLPPLKLAFLRVPPSSGPAWYHRLGFENRS